MNRTIFLAGIIAVTLVAGIIASGELVEAIKPMETNDTGTFLDAFVFGTLICPDETAHPSSQLRVKVDMTSLGSGIFHMTVPQEDAISSGGGFVGSMSTETFAFKIIVDEQTCAGSPNQAGLATVMSFNGICGIDGEIDLSTNTGVTGTFTGKIACI